MNKQQQNIDNIKNNYSIYPNYWDTPTPNQSF